MYSIRDVAKIAGVSIATVSNFINGTRALRPETAEKVKLAISQLNYQPNNIARSLKVSESNDIGVILPTIIDPYYAGVFKGIENVFNSDGIIINPSFTDELIYKERSAFYSFMKKRIKGLIIATCQPENRAFFEENISAEKLPAVFIDRLVPNINANSVSVDTYYTVYDITKKLLRLGYRNIAVFTGPEYYSSEQKCIRAYLDAYEEANITPNLDLIRPVLQLKEDAFSSCLHLFSENPVDAVVSSSLVILDGVLEAMHVRHAEPGDNIPVVSLGIDIWNVRTSYPNVFLTLRPSIDIGEKAAELLKENIANPNMEPREIILEDRVNLNLMTIPQKSPNVRPHPCREKLRIILESNMRSPDMISGLKSDFEFRENTDVIIESAPMEKLLDIIKQDVHKRHFDIIMYDIPWLPSLAKDDILCDISDYMETRWNAENCISPDLTSAFGEFQGRFYGIPFLYSPPILFYRTDLFEDSILKAKYQEKYQLKLRPPKTWYEYNYIAEFFNDPAINAGRCRHGVCLYGLSKEHLIPNFLPRLTAFGGSIFNSKMQITINSSACRKALLSMKKSSEQSSISFDKASLEGATKEFYDGETAMLFGHSSYAVSYAKDRLSPVYGKVAYAPLPGNTPHLAGWGLGISSASRNKNLAFKFLNWISRQDISNYMTIINGQSLLYGSYPSSELMKIYPWISVEIDTFKDCQKRTAAFFPNGNMIPRDLIEATIYTNISSYLMDETSIDETIKKMEKDLKILFHEYDT